MLVVSPPSAGGAPASGASPEKAPGPLESLVTSGARSSSGKLGDLTSPGDSPRSGALPSPKLGRSDAPSRLTVDPPLEGKSSGHGFRQPVDRNHAARQNLAQRDTYPDGPVVVAPARAFIRCLRRRRPHRPSARHLEVRCRRPHPGLTAPLRPRQRSSLRMPSCPRFPRRRHFLCCSRPLAGVDYRWCHRSPPGPSHRCRDSETPRAMDSGKPPATRPKGL